MHFYTSPGFTLLIFNTLRSANNKELANAEQKSTDPNVDLIQEPSVINSDSSEVEVQWTTSLVYDNIIGPSLLLPNSILPHENMTSSSTTSSNFIDRSTTTISSSNKSSPSHIPPIMHQLWKTHNISTVFKYYPQTWKKIHPHWKFMFWTDNSMRNFMMIHYKEFLTLYDKYENAIRRADAFRYFILYHYGGVYADLDVECLRSFDDLRKSHFSLFGLEPAAHAYFYHQKRHRLVGNAIMASTRHHRFLRYIIDHLEANHVKYKGSLLDSTGPRMVDNMVQAYVNETNNSGPVQDSVYLAPAELFSPKIVSGAFNYFRTTCRIHKKSNDLFVRDDLCPKLVSRYFSKNRNKSERVYSIHHYANTWIG